MSEASPPLTQARPAVSVAGAYESIRALVPRVVDLVRSMEKPSRMATDRWTAVDAAAHLTHVWAAELAVLRGEGPPVSFRGDVAAMNAAALDADPERSPGILAQRLQATALQVMTLLAEDPSDGPRTWLGGLELPVSTVASHLVHEVLLHGWDIARSQRRGWRMSPRDAEIALHGFSLHLISVLPPEFFVRSDVDARDGSVCVRLRGGGRFGMHFHRGRLTLVGEEDRPFDCRVSVTPATWLLLSSGRGSVAAALATGRIRIWGRRPTFLRTLQRSVRMP